jgi:hypothetical protein
MHKEKAVYYLILAFCLLACSNLPAFSVQTIINSPSSEILPQDTIIFKESNNIPTDGLTRMGPSVIFGLGHGLEVSSGVSTFVSGDDPVRADISAKKVFFLNDSMRLTVGGRVSPYLNQKSEPDTFVYSHVSHRIKKTKTTLTAGVYSASRQDSIPSNAGVILGVEQAMIPNKLRLVVDYMSGSDQYGLFAAGFKYRPVSTLSITSAVLVSPSEDDRIAFSLSISKFISLKKHPSVKEHI